MASKQNKTSKTDSVSFENKLTESENSLETQRHSISHIMALAVKALYPEVKFGIGPSIENGFYYDFALPAEASTGTQVGLSPADLPKIESKMKELLKQNLAFKKKNISKTEAKKLFKDQPYKLELIKKLPGKTASLYESGGFVDLCKGPHIKNTAEINPKAFKLSRVAGAYWLGNEKNPMLTRIYGLYFATEKELSSFVAQQEEAEKRDHRILGQKLDLFLINPMVGMGLVMWQPKGAMLWRIMEDFWYKEHLKNGYELVRTPHIGSRKLWETSGHWGFYNDSMYPPLEVSQTLKDIQEKKKAKAKEEYLLKPMNCPFHITLYNSKPRSYRELPIRWAECGTVYRYEKSGELSGLTRVRGFTQDDAHIICSKEQVKDELKRVARFIVFTLKTFGFNDFNVYLSLRDPKNKKKYAGNDVGWDFTQKVLAEVAEEMGFAYKKEEGEAAFYGPKLDFKIKDCLGREWQCSTLQFDFNLPDRFKMSFINQKSEKEQPYVLHRVLFGSFERFIGVLIEHYAGAFPLWLSPVQVKILPITERHNDYALGLAEKLKEQNIRVETALEADTLGKKIREAEMQKIPYLLIVGDKEIANKSVAVRQHGKGDLGSMPLPELTELLLKEITIKK
ncbi:threonine--tRNA ligase [bacterium (Candidatus Gribaldobacteria) CG23_combo_of_CG06-09_8_20_14_all_37_87_8]|uniref:Threonine--tRNA ligase n=2 Tax=Candidatus Gribaldobacteria TaxID=2798536 RepID=A0A2G9ZFG2_9BACT|nr:MAG: threonine--tRNA ligase [Parcubacteria group bacterium CG1_02_37_13]PIP31915.1 MAG: threonine--tRNA ligase [bacterium (Candidatus Gribaldobacteria) CG23_combo_of_CG06-09_8_20_14_all_37_87_8]PIR90385.1 MAG: threonine--tRNA ligase [bacterium (Candidatus Gribaldobacteria) CG10_big_fil_rev_8_21_14_0_10_37_21]